MPGEILTSHGGRFINSPTFQVRSRASVGPIGPLREASQFSPRQAKVTPDGLVEGTRRYTAFVATLTRGRHLAIAASPSGRLDGPGASRPKLRCIQVFDLRLERQLVATHLAQSPSASRASSSLRARERSMESESAQRGNGVR